MANLLKRLVDEWHVWRLALRIERLRTQWRRAMMEAVREAAKEGLFAQSSLPDGLRAIRNFEEVNKRKFDPFNEWHVLLVANAGWHFSLQRRLNALKPPEAA